MLESPWGGVFASPCLSSKRINCPSEHTWILPLLSISTSSSQPLTPAAASPLASCFPLFPLLQSILPWQSLPFKKQKSDHFTSLLKILQQLLVTQNKSSNAPWHA